MKKPAFSALKTQLLLPGLGWVAVFFLLPFLCIVVASVSQRSSVALFEIGSLTGAEYRAVFQPVHFNYFFNSVVFSLLTSFLCAVLAYPLALFISSQPRSKKYWFLLFAILPLFTNYLVRLFALTLLLRPTGPVAAFTQKLGFDVAWLGSSLGIVLGMVYVSLPLMVMPLFAAIDKIDRALLEAARDLGATHRQVFFKIIFPLSKRGLLAGTLFVLIPNLGELLIPRVLGGGKIPVLGTLIEEQFLGRVQSHWPLGAALTVVLTLVVIPAVFFEVRSSHAGQTSGVFK